MFKQKQLGFGLVEVLVTLGVLTVGVLGVSTLHSAVTRQSLDNKARNEALMIAQSRIETLRNFTGDVDTLTEFNTTYANTTGYANSFDVEGVNASFTRTESISTNGGAKNLGVQVAWTDVNGDAKNVQLNSELAFISPRSAGDSGRMSVDPLVDAPTGRAKLGEGELPEDAEVEENGDGTSLYNDNSGDLKLVSDDTIVLTLLEACQTESGECIDFVKIKGTVYIDKGSQSSLAAKDVNVIASDAAYCARYYNSSGTNIPITDDTTTVSSTANGHYDYFHYTCYLGGGWHGNVGILLSGGNTDRDKFCIGDPTSEEAYADPVVAARRVYRGMLYKKDGGSRVQREGMDLYFSQGIGDSVELPDPNASQHSHDFVVGSMNANDNDGSYCESEGLMTRGDANVSGESGDLFADVPTDFVCLNDGYLDTYDADVYGNDSSCPFDPSNPPSTSYTIGGDIRLDAAQNEDNLKLALGMYPVTSDGANNCKITTDAAEYGTSGYQSTYQCRVYVWIDGTEDYWNGSVKVKYDASQVNCTETELAFADLSSDDNSGNDFTTCSTGSYAVYTGTVSSTGSRKLQSAAMSNGGACTVASDKLSYSCTVTISAGSTWEGTLTFAPTAGIICNGNTYTFSNVAGGNYTRDLKIVARTRDC